MEEMCESEVVVFYFFFKAALVPCALLCLSLAS